MLDVGLNHISNAHISVIISIYVATSQMNNLSFEIARA